VLTVAWPLVVAEVKACDSVVEEMVDVDSGFRDDTAIEREVVAADDVESAKLEVCCGLDELVELMTIDTDIVPVGALLEEEASRTLDEEGNDEALEDIIKVLLGAVTIMLPDDEASMPFENEDVPLLDEGRIALLDDKSTMLLLVSM
jgi:hypothetical protein